MPIPKFFRIPKTPPPPTQKTLRNYDPIQVLFQFQLFQVWYEECACMKRYFHFSVCKMAFKGFCEDMTGPRCRPRHKKKSAYQWIPPQKYKESSPFINTSCQGEKSAFCILVCRCNINRLHGGQNDSIREKSAKHVT